MKVEVINTGTELLLGNVTNTHLPFLGQELFPLGLRVERQVCVPDGPAIRDALLESFGRADIVLVTGGLVIAPPPVGAMMAASLPADFGVPVRWAETRSATTNMPQQFCGSWSDYGFEKLFLILEIFGPEFSGSFLHHDTVKIHSSY